MQVKKQNIFNKIVKKDYNEMLEKILEKKQFDGYAKSTLLSILYKIQASYKDVETVKKDVESKEEYIENLIDIIENKCNSIKILKINETDEKLKNRTYYINKTKKQIISYPIESKILYAIYKISNNDKIIKKDYYIINETLANLLNVGSNINKVEPLRDFNGYSWVCPSQEIESITHNLIYQNLRIMVGDKFLNSWLKNNEYILDYFELFKERLEGLYGKKVEEKIIKNISDLSILIDIKFNKKNIEKYTNEKIDIENKYNIINNNSEYTKELTKEKIKLNKKIREIDEIISNKNLLEKEYVERNNSLPLNKKIFSLKVLSKILEEEKEGYFDKIIEINDMLNPKTFSKYKKEIKQKYETLKILDYKDLDESIKLLEIELQKLFIYTLRIRLQNSKTKQEIEKLIYDLRYYLLIPYSKDLLIRDIKEIHYEIEDFSRLLIRKANELKVIEKFSQDSKTNEDILTNIFNVRIIRLEDAYLKIIKDSDKYFIQIFDENNFEEKVEIKNVDGLQIKINKKIKIFI